MDIKKKQRILRYAYKSGILNVDDPLYFSYIFYL